MELSLPISWPFCNLVFFTCFFCYLVFLYYGFLVKWFYTHSNGRGNVMQSQDCKLRMNSFDFATKVRNKNKCSRNNRKKRLNISQKLRNLLHLNFVFDNNNNNINNSCGNADDINCCLCHIMQI